VVGFRDPRDARTSSRLPPENRGFITTQEFGPVRGSAIAAHELTALPRWGAVALASRCVCRVFPLFVRSWPEATREQELAVLRAAVGAQEAARSGQAPPIMTEIIRGAAETSRAARGPVAVAISGAARSVATAASIADMCARGPSATLESLLAAALGAACVSARAAVDLASRETDPPDTNALVAFDAAVRRDCDVLRAMTTEADACGARLTHHAPVDARDLGPLWPEGSAPAWAI
jgi:hypothetical protein